MSERFKVTKHDEPSGKTYKNYGATSAESDVELKGKLLPDSAAPGNSARIVGGSETTISQYPHMVAVLFSFDFVTYMQSCGGTIINHRSILTAAHCLAADRADRWRARVGSTFASSGGVVHSVQYFIMHPQYNFGAFANNDIAILRTAVGITYVNNAVQPGRFAGANYNVGDNQVVWAAGWGTIESGGPTSEVLRHVQIWTVNQGICADRYRGAGFTITENMMCSGWLDVGGRDQCQQDSGGPLYHNGVVVGVCSFGNGCASPYYPGINARVSRFISWIEANA